jgi:ribokinase
MIGGAYALAPTAVVKRGARGIRVVGETEVELPAAAGDVVDATGAGDALAAGFIVGGAELAVETAARCVAKVGAMP